MKGFFAAFFYRLNNALIRICNLVVINATALYFAGNYYQNMGIVLIAVWLYPIFYIVNGKIQRKYYRDRTILTDVPISESSFVQKYKENKHIKPSGKNSIGFKEAICTIMAPRKYPDFLAKLRKRQELSCEELKIKIGKGLLLAKNIAYCLELIFYIGVFYMIYWGFAHNVDVLSFADFANNDLGTKIFWVTPLILLSLLLMAYSQRMDLREKIKILKSMENKKQSVKKGEYDESAGK
ncbi:hypothetical protein CQA49_00820 [Helicobacter sp. MIT 00-7814]|uniref:hypothetical protein n=1 Tax=unclassified Helicobacter TaxID=2593540 RepID=UPI000E1F3901|nr:MULTISPECIES: hypothetical protein [unclassified Helicobacter]RDU55055.1 hypothetical protein CQA37_04410 [Helicobacter sp. MIT 99-10781]RDU56874.1 hypothetical protein CQA49_00820 [Helicobacter sp. MIT 00-7814]